MSLSKIANVIDFEFDQGLPIQFGVTFVNLDSRTIGKTSIYYINYGDTFKISPRIAELTGIKDKQLRNSSTTYSDLYSIVEHSLGARNRLWVADSDDDFNVFCDYDCNYSIRKRLNVSDLFGIKHKLFKESLSLEGMLKKEGLEFEGRQHDAGDDSKNIARLYLKVMGV